MHRLSNRLYRTRNLGAKSLYAINIFTAFSTVGWMLCCFFASSVTIYQHQNTMQVIKFGLLILLFCTSSGIAISCYQCSYISTLPDDNCYGPNLTSSLLFDCSTSYCSTIVAKADIAGIKSTTITRNCADVDINQCENIFGVDTCVYTCSTDGCNNGNGSKKVAASFSTFLFTICISLLFLKL